MNRHNFTLCLGVAGLCALLLSASPAPGETVSYVNGSSSVFGASIQYGDTLMFTPTGFSSLSSGANAVNMIDGALRVWITATTKIDQVIVDENGACFFFGGRPTDLTRAYVGANAAQLFITSVNGASINGPLISLTSAMQYTPASPVAGSRTFLATEPIGAGGWHGTMLFDGLANALAGTPYAGGRVTGVMLVFDDILATTSEAGTLSYIDTKSVWITADTAPEPSSLALLATASLLGLAYGLRKRHSAQP